MQLPGRVRPRKKRPDSKSLIANNIGSELHHSKWGSVLCKAAESRIPPGSNVVDLGAGPKAVVARHMIESGVEANWLAIEPYYSVKAPSEVKVVRGNLRVLSPNSVDVILFNPPVVPRQYLNSSSSDYHLFLSGADWTETIDEAILESQRCLSRTGHLIILCPTFLQPPLLLEKKPRVLEYDYESFISFCARAPLHQSVTAEEMILDLQRRSDASALLWERLGVPPRPSSFAIVALEVHYS